MLFKEEQLIGAAYIPGLSGRLEDTDLLLSARYIPIRENSRLHGYTVRYNQAMDYADTNGYSLDEAVNRISGANGIPFENLIVAVNEYDFNTDPLVEATVMNCECAIAISPYNYDKDIVYKTFEEAVEYCLEEGKLDAWDGLIMGIEEALNEEAPPVPSGTSNNTGSTPSVQSGGGNFVTNTINKFKNKGKAMVNDITAATKNKLVSNVKDQISKGIGYLSNNQNAQDALNNIKNNVSSFVSGTLKDTVNKTIKDATGMDNATDFLKGMGKGAGGAAALLATVGISSSLLKSAMNEKELENGNPSMLKRMKNSVVGLLNRVTGRQNAVPQQQRGMLDTLIDKIKSFLSRINAKLGGQG